MADQQITLSNDSSQEIWRDVPGFEGIYQASSHGRIKRIGRWSRMIGRVVKPYVDKKGYYRIGLSRDGIRKTPPLVHHVIAATFIGPRPPGLVINHIDGNKLNNTPGNLEYCTYAENSRHGSKIGLLARGKRHGTHTQPHTRCIGEKHGQAKLTDASVREIKRLLSQGESGSLLARRFNVNPSAISKIKHGTAWKHIN